MCSASLFLQISLWTGRLTAGAACSNRQRCRHAGFLLGNTLGRPDIANLMVFLDNATLTYVCPSCISLVEVQISLSLHSDSFFNSQTHMRSPPQIDQALSVGTSQAVTQLLCVSKEEEGT